MGLLQDLAAISKEIHDVRKEVVSSFETVRQDANQLKKEIATPLQDAASQTTKSLGSLKTELKQSAEMLKGQQPKTDQTNSTPKQRL